jgi:hypothetical protein
MGQTAQRQKTTIGVVFSMVLCTMLLSTSCVEETPEERYASPNLVSRGIISATLNRYIEAGSEEPFEQFGLTGVFARFPEKESGTVDLLWENRLADVDLGLDRCTDVSPVLDHRARLHLPPSKRAIELLDVGDLTVSFNGTKKPIPTRTFPDLLNVVVGVIYAADETQGVVFRPGETYGVQATGINDGELFQVALEAPEDLGAVEVNGTTPGEDIPFLSRGRRVVLTWDGDGFGDEVIATISWTRMGSPWEVTCRMRDDGRFVIPANITVNLPDPLTSTDEEVTLSRVRQVVFRSTDLSTGSFRFIVSTHFPIKF